MTEDAVAGSGERTPRSTWWVRLVSRETGRYYTAVAVWLVVFAAGSLGWTPRLELDAYVPNVTAYVTGLSVFLAVYVAMTGYAFVFHPAESLREAPARGGWFVRWVVLPHPGTLMALGFCPLVLLTSAAYLPLARSVGGPEDTLAATAVSGVAVVLAWAALTITYAADYAIRDHRSGGLRFPSTPCPRFVDYLYVAGAVSTTFGTTDVEVTAPELRRVVIAHSVVAFVFNTVIVSLLVGSLVR